MSSLTRLEAKDRGRMIGVDSYEIALDLTAGPDHFDSTSTIRFTCAEPGGTTFLDVAANTLTSVRLNGVDLDISGYATGDRRIVLPSLGADNHLVIDAVMAYSHDGEGLHRHVDPADGRVYTYAMSFLDAAPRWFACFDQPDLKAPVTLEVRCPIDWTVAGNGPSTTIEPGLWRISSTGPLATYFTTVVAGPYHQVRAEHDTIPLVLHCRQSLADYVDSAANELFAHTARCLDSLHELFGTRYPWGEYHQAFVPDFNAGAMENPGCVTISESLVFRSAVTDAERLTRLVTIAHEMAHMWFGDLVTMRWWDDLWLNESFAEYLGTRITGDAAWVAFGAQRKSWGYAADRRPSTHPIAGNGADDAASALTSFDGISYAKGASVLRQLATRLGDELFLAGLRHYITAHAHGNASFVDLTACWTAAAGQGSGPELDSWLTTWLRTTGMDELRAEGGDVSGHGPTPREHAIDVASYDSAGTELARRRVIVGCSDNPRGSAPTPPGTSLVLPDAGDDTWAKTVLPARAWSTMTTTLSGMTDARARVAVWNALVLAVADAEVDPVVALDIATAVLPAETDDAILSTFGRWAIRTVVGTCLDERAGGSALGRLHSAVREVVEDPRTSAGRRLAAVRLTVASAVDPQLLREWLDGSSAPGDLTIDRDLRWALTLRLAQLGAIGGAQIAAEADTDQSLHGAVHAARCRAALPDPGAKREAFETIMADPARTNSELYALAEGFWVPEQRELTDPFVPAYVERIAATAVLRSGYVVGRLAGLAFPWTAVDAATLDATQALLAHDDLDAGIRRAVLDAGDDLRRAVEIVTKYRQ